MSLCLSEAAANTRGRFCLRPSISGRCACTVPLPSQHARAVPAPWPHGWGRPLAVAAPTTPRSHVLAEAVLQRPLSPARLCRATPALSPHASEEASDRVCRADDATPAQCPHGLAKAAYLTAAAAGTPALCPHGLGCVAATAARTRAEHTAEYRAAAAVGGFPVHTM